MTSNQVAITNPRMPPVAADELPEVEISSRVLYSGKQRMELGDEGVYFLKSWISDFQYRIDLMALINLLIYVFTGLVHLR